jgi:hypothetical protein
MYAAVSERSGALPEPLLRPDLRLPVRTTTALYLTVPWLEIHDLPVAGAVLPPAERCVVHLPDTGFPWQPGANVCLEDAGGRHALHDLPSIREGDAVVLRDMGGREYGYRVTETLTASPRDAAALSRLRAPMPGRDLLSLQTLVPATEPGTLFVARADRVRRGS